MKRALWSPEQLQILRARYPHETTAAVAVAVGMTPKQTYAKANAIGLRKTPEFMSGPLSGCIKPGERRGRGTEFKPGQATWNKGTNFMPGGRCAETQFKPGQRPHTWHPVGHERLTKEGYLQRKMTDTGITRRDYVAVHHLVWFAAGNTIPPGYALGFKDGDKTHITLDNLELVHRSELMRRNSVHNYPKEVAALMQLRGAVSRQINKRKGKNNGKDSANA